MLPLEVLERAQSEMLCYGESGMSVMEMSHRSKAYDTIIKEAEADLRDLMNIPDNYKVLFLQGGAHQQFAMIPMNLMKNKVADYIVTGMWAKKAFAEAGKYGKVNKIATSEDETFSYIPDCSDLPISEDADYVYICENNTIYGTKFPVLPNTKGKPLVSDQSSCFLSEPIDVSKYGGAHIKIDDVIETLKDIKIVTIFLRVPKEELRRRLENRIDKPSEGEIILRLNRFDYEESKIGMYDYVLKNDNLEKTVNVIEEIIRQEMLANENK